MWFAIYQISDGTLISLATVVADPLPAGLAKKQVAAHSAGLQWNPTLLDWEPAPPPPPDVDRVDEVIAAIEAVQSLTARVKNALRPELENVLGEHRWRDPDEGYMIRRER